MSTQRPRLLNCGMLIGASVEVMLRGLEGLADTRWSARCQRWSAGFMNRLTASGIAVATLSMYLAACSAGGVTLEYRRGYAFSEAERGAVESVATRGSRCAPSPASIAARPADHSSGWHECDTGDRRNR